LIAVVSERDAQKINSNICRILDDVIVLFARQGVMTVTWLNSLPKYEVNETALNAWEITRAKSLVGFENLNIVFVNDNTDLPQCAYHVVFCVVIVLAAVMFPSASIYCVPPLAAE
jgi:hypothetical protein